MECSTAPRLFAHRNHPLRQAGALTPDQSRHYPLPSLPVGMAPLLMRQLQDDCLATSFSLLRYSPGANEDGLHRLI